MKKKTKWTSARDKQLARNFNAAVGKLGKNAPDLLPLFAKALKLALHNDLKRSSAVFKKLREEYSRRDKEKRQRRCAA